MIRAWGVHPSVAHGAAILANLEAKTGRTLEAWLALAKKAKLQDAKAARAFFKAQGLNMAAGGYLAELALGAEIETPASHLAKAQGYVDAQYGGKKAALRPLFERLLALAYALGEDVRACPCQTIVPLYRRRVFAEVKPFASRLDFGLVLGDPAKLKDPSGRLMDTGGFAKKDRITVKLEVRGEADLDAVLQGWLRKAYELDA